MERGGSWSELEEHRRAVCRRWPSIWRLEVVPRAARYAAARIRPGDRVLDVGASTGRLEERLPAGAEYRTLDVDPRVNADFSALDEVDEASFDVVTCLEMIEHVPFPEARAVAAGILRALRPGGRLFLSTPNVHHPWEFLGSPTHVTPFRYDQLGALLEAAGLTLDRLLRCHNDAFLKRIVRKLAYPVYRLTAVDYARSILAVAHRPTDSTSSEK